MIHIAGGSYLESCITPYWSQLYGSGGRAAAALSKLTDQITLHTYIGDTERDLLDHLAETYHFVVDAASIQQTLAFHYFHGLSVPALTPPIGKTIQEPPLSVATERILRFGMLEGDAVVHGQWVVYDPQDPLNPRSFSANGSRAEHLAIVGNYSETAGLSGQRRLSDIGRALLTNHGAEVVVIKRGVMGATVITPTTTTTVPAYRTETVWPIGSGDVFAAVFAYFWAVQQTDPVDAARAASLATASYCGTRALPIPKSVFESPPFHPVSVPLSVEHELSHHPQVYLAGPFFTMAQRWLVEEAQAALRSNQVTVFSPLHDVGRGSAAQVVQADIDGLDRSNAVFALLDGHDVGTVFEVGYASAKGIPVVAFAENETPEDLKMLEGTNCQIIHDFVSAVYATLWTVLER